MTIPPLTTERLRLRPFTEDDIPTLARLANDRAVAKTTTIPFPYTEAHARAWIATHAPAAERGERLVWAITEAHTGQLMGAIELRFLTARHVGELAYWLGKAFWGQGYTTEAARAVLAYGFGKAGLYRIQAQHFHTNPASGRVMQKIGMTYEGTRRAAVFRWEQYHDMLMYAILKPEYERLRAAGEEARA
ncbi:MAG TPA: N-acetyltransferase [Chloroflexi bacterium]|nr:N-acetyltransferase [Chloroflexota bacterium]